MKKVMHPRFTDILKKMLIDDHLEYFVAFYSFVDFYEAEGLGTFGIGVKNLRLCLLYDTKFLEQQSDAELKYLMIHELHHPLWNHQGRCKGRDREFANSVMDCIINHVIDTQFGANYKNANGKVYTLASRPVVHQEDFNDPMRALALLQNGMKVGDETGCRIAPEYLKLVEEKKADLVFEPLYDWMMKNQPPTKPSFDFHPDLSEQEQELLKRITKEVHEKAKQLSNGRGTDSSYIDKMTELMLKTAKNNNIKDISKACQTVRGYLKQASYRRPNRKVEGVKGHKRTGHAITVLHDWSGSMMGSHEAVLGEIFRDGYELMFVGGDVQIHTIQKVTRKEQLKTIVVQGGGTELSPMIREIAKNPKLNKNPLVILTDGYTDTLDLTTTKQKVLILSTGTECPVNGNAKQIIIGNGV